MASFVAEPLRGLDGFSEADWQSALWWLDISGMAIYFLDRVWQTGSDTILPSAIREQLEQRLERNLIRIEALRKEAAILANWFRIGGVPYCLLKGITLTPDAVPDSALRCQTDLDFLVDDRSVDQAVHYLRRLDYRLHARNGNTLEFRAGDPGLPNIGNMYSVKAQRALELHLVPSRSGLLKRRATRDFEGAMIDTLSPADILVQQALHLLKHLCGEHTRLSWVLEFWRNVSARRADAEFWQEVESIAVQEHNGQLAIGIALRVAETMFGKLDYPEMIHKSAFEALPSRIHLWLNRYLRDLLLSDAIGSKLYALLRNEVPTRPDHTRKTLMILFPNCMPARVTQAKAQESLAERLERYDVELSYFLRRLRFHVVEGARFGVEALRWRRAILRCGQ